MRQHALQLGAASECKALASAPETLQPLALHPRNFLDRFFPLGYLRRLRAAAVLRHPLGQWALLPITRSEQSFQHTPCWPKQQDSSFPFSRRPPELVLLLTVLFPVPVARISRTCTIQQSPCISNPFNLACRG